MTKRSILPFTVAIFAVARMIEENQIRSAQPPEDAQCWFLTVTDEREVTVSSRLMFPGR